MRKVLLSFSVIANKHKFHVELFPTFLHRFGGRQLGPMSESVSGLVPSTALGREPIRFVVGRLGGDGKLRKGERGSPRVWGCRCCNRLFDRFNRCTFDTRVSSHSLPRALNLCIWERQLLLVRFNRQLRLLTALALVALCVFVFVVRRPLLRLYLRARPLKDNWPNSCSVDCKTPSSLSLSPVNAACLICCIPLSIPANGFGRSLYRFGGCSIVPATCQHAHLQLQTTDQEKIKEEA